MYGEGSCLYHRVDIIVKVFDGNLNEIFEEGISRIAALLQAQNPVDWKIFFG